MEKFMKGIAMLLIAAIVGCGIYYAHQYIELRKETQVKSDETDITNLDTVYINKEQVIQDMLDIQQMSIEQHVLDSTFLKIPKDIIVLILYNNINRSSYEITKEYLRNKEFYDDWLIKHKEVNNFNTIQKKQENILPDKMPSVANPDKALSELVDSI